MVARWPPCTTPAARHGLTSLPAGTTSSSAKTSKSVAVYLTNTPYGDRFVWSMTNDRKVPGVSISGWAETLDKATAADAEELWTDAREGRAA